MLTCMLAKLRSCFVPAALVCIGVGVTIGNAPAVTVEVAKKCAALTAKAFPPRVVGNPAAGFVTRTGQSQQSYFNNCVANGGSVSEEPGPQPVPMPRERRPLKSRGPRGRADGKAQQLPPPAKPAH
jgi:hypothetical protein